MALILVLVPWMAVPVAHLREGQSGYAARRDSIWRIARLAARFFEEANQGFDGRMAVAARRLCVLAHPRDGVDCVDALLLEPPVVGRCLRVVGNGGPDERLELVDPWSDHADTARHVRASVGEDAGVPSCPAPRTAGAEPVTPRATDSRRVRR